MTIAYKPLILSLLLTPALHGVAEVDEARKALNAKRMALNQTVEAKTGTPESYEKGLTDKDATVRELSIRGLEALGTLDAAEQVAPLLAKDQDPAVREEAARALKAWKNPSTLPVLIKGAKDPVVNVRVLCVEALAASPAPQAHSAVLAAAKDAAPEVRRTVMSEFAHASTPDVVPAVTAALSDPDPAVRANAAQAISFYAKLHMPAELKNLLSDPDPTVQASAARSLIQGGDEEGLKTALELVKSDNQTARLLAIDALGYSKDPEAKTTLAQVVANSTDSYDREGAQLALKRIGQKHPS